MIKSLPKETYLNINSGMISYAFHRISGIAISVYLILHIYTLGAVGKGEEAFNHSIAKYDNLFGHFMEYLILIAVVYHTLNGIRIIFADFFNMTLLHKRLILLTWIAFVLILGYSISYFFPGLSI
ncbi:succinate dehydrogenase, cytochrome b556 subunit [candidate division KSB1 bacterium]